MKLQTFLKIFTWILLLQLSLYAKTSTKPQILETTTITTINGEKIEVQRMKNGLLFKGYEDKIVLLEAFGHSCPPCKASIPGYNRLQQKYQNNIVILAVEVWGSDNSGLKQYAKQHNIHYKAVSKASSGKLIRFMQNMTGWVSGLGVPYLMLYTRGGVLVKDVPPQRLNEDYVDGLIKNILQK